MSSVPSLVIVPLMLAGTGWDVHGCYQAICISMALASLLALFTTRIPLMIGPQIAGVSYLVGHLHGDMGWSANLLAWAVMASALFFFLAIALKLPQRLMKAVGPTLQQAITATLGAFFIVLAFRDFPHLKSSLYSLGGDFNWVFGAMMIALVPTMIIEFLQRRGFASAMMVGMLISLLAGYALKIEHGFMAASERLPWQWNWLDWQQVDALTGGWQSWIWGVFGLWMIQTLDVAGCALAMSDLAAKRWGFVKGSSTDLQVEDSEKPHQMPSFSKLYRLAPLGTLLGFCSGTLAAAGPHCIYLSSAAALCSRTRQSIVATGLIASLAFLLMLPLKSQLLSLPLYLSLPVILWIGIAMIRHLPTSRRDHPLGDLIGGWIMVAAVFITGQLLGAMAMGVWAATLWNLLIDRKIVGSRLLLSLLFLLNQLAWQLA